MKNLLLESHFFEKTRLQIYQDYNYWENLKVSEKWMKKSCRKKVSRGNLLSVAVGLLPNFYSQSVSVSQGKEQTLEEISCVIEKGKCAKKATTKEEKIVFFGDF